MKNKLKVILGTIVGIIIGTSITVYAYNYQAKDIGFKPSNESWEVDNVEDAINYLYDGKTSNLELVGVVNGGKNASSTKATTVLKYNLEKGNYLVFLGDARRSNGSKGLGYNTTTEIGTFSGHDGCKLLIYTVNGQYYETTTTRANLRLNVYECTFDDAGTLTYTSTYEDDDRNISLVIFKK